MFNWFGFARQLSLHGVSGICIGALEKILKYINRQRCIVFRGRAPQLGAHRRAAGRGNGAAVRAWSLIVARWFFCGGGRGLAGTGRRGRVMLVQCAGRVRQCFSLCPPVASPTFQPRTALRAGGAGRHRTWSGAVRGLGLQVCATSSAAEAAGLGYANEKRSAGTVESMVFVSLATNLCALRRVTVVGGASVRIFPRAGHCDVQKGPSVA